MKTQSGAAQGHNSIGLAYAKPSLAQSDGVLDVTPSLARIVILGGGLHVLAVGPVTAVQRDNTKIDLPATLVAAAPTEDGYDLVDVAASSAATLGWLPARGGTVIVKAPPDGGVVLVTTFGVRDEADLPGLKVSRLDQPLATGNEKTPPRNAVRVEREIPIEITLHVEGQGDCRFKGNSWAGAVGSQLRIEAFAIHPLVALKSNEIEYMACGPQERKTPWTTDSKLCGTRGLRMPLTGFAIRLAPSLQQHFDVVYEGSFFRSGGTNEYRNGELCTSSIPADPLEAIRVRITQYVSS